MSSLSIVDPTLIESDDSVYPETTFVIISKPTKVVSILKKKSAVVLDEDFQVDTQVNANHLLHLQYIKQMEEVTRITRMQMLKR